MLKVLSIASYRFLPPATGGQKCIAFFNRYFSKYIAFTCISVPQNETNNTETYEVVPLLGSGRFRYINPLLFFRLRTFIRQNRITHVLLEHPYYGWLGYLLKKFTGVQLVVHAHNIEALRFRDIGKWWWKILWRYERGTFRTADTIFFITEEDRQYAIHSYGIPAGKSIVVTYGTTHDQIPTHETKKKAKHTVAALHGFDNSQLLLLYSAAFNYAPNLQALDDILQNINPALQQSVLQYKIIVCGMGLPGEYGNLKQYESGHIIFAGFVEDINLYFTAADIFLNPVSEGGGIKTKLVEALAANTNSISYQRGAYGVPLTITGNKLQIVADSDAVAFSGAVLRSVQHLGENTPSSFLDHFHWDNIARKAAEKLQEDQT